MNRYLNKSVQWDVSESVVRSIDKSSWERPNCRRRRVDRPEFVEKSKSQEMFREVLLVENSPGDVRLAREAFRDVNASVRLHGATNGVEAAVFLGRQDTHFNAPRPDLILLDLNLPKMDGREVLPLIKKDDSLKTNPTLILTTSEAQADVANSYQLHANCYLNKAVRFDAFESLVNSINDFWLIKVKLPAQAPSG